MSTRTTRLPTDLLEAAEAEGRMQQRSTTKQVERWARFGMYFDAQTSATKRRIERAVEGGNEPDDLSEDEAMVANALIDARITSAATSISFAERLAARGVTTVGLDEAGNIVRRSPDGTITPL